MYQKQRKIRGTVAGFREKDQQLTDVLHVLRHYSDKFNIEFRSNNKSIELAESCRYAYRILRDCLDNEFIEIKEKLK